MWKIVKQLIPGGSKLLKSQFDDIIDKVERFNEFFSDVGRATYSKTQESVNETESQPILEIPVHCNGQYFRPSPVSVDTLILTIKQLNETNAVGIDDIAYRFVIDSLPVTSFYLTVCVNTSIATGDYPSVWRHALVTPTFKSGDPDEITNYRPISILPILSKIIEKVVANQLMDFLEANKLLSNTQHGFRRGLSTETALLDVANKIYDNMDHNKITLLTLCDLSKAFDSVNHELLLSKLKSVKVDPFWFVSYLSGRTQSVKMDNTISSKREVSFGVPQGSILGPILFLIFVNDMTQIATGCSLVQYADDSQFIHTGTVDRIDELIKDAELTLRNAKKYFDKNGLLVNASKTQVIFIGSRQNISKVPENIKIRFDESDITPSKCVKNLGVYLDSYMTFNAHIDETYKKTMGILMYLNRIKYKLTPEMRSSVVQSLALSHINYCIKIWGTAGITQIKRMQKLQNFAAKIVEGNSRKYDHATPIINNLQWLKVKQKFIFEVCTFIYKILNDHLPRGLLALATVGDVGLVQTRQQHNLVIPRTSTVTGERNLAVKGPKLWNDLPLTIKNAPSLYTFKRNLREYILSSQED